MIGETYGEVAETFRTRGNEASCTARQQAMQEESKLNPFRRTGRAKES